MHKLIQLIKWEYLIQNRINNLSKYLFIFFLFCIFNDRKFPNDFTKKNSNSTSDLQRINCSTINYNVKN